MQRAEKMRSEGQVPASQKNAAAWAEAHCGQIENGSTSGDRPQSGNKHLFSQLQPTFCIDETHLQVSHIISIKRQKAKMRNLSIEIALQLTPQVQRQGSH